MVVLNTVDQLQLGADSVTTMYIGESVVWPASAIAYDSLVTVDTEGPLGIWDDPGTTHVQTWAPMFKQAVSFTAIEDIYVYGARWWRPGTSDGINPGNNLTMYLGPDTPGATATASAVWDGTWDPSEARWITVMFDEPVSVAAGQSRQIYMNVTTGGSVTIARWANYFPGGANSISGLYSVPNSMARWALDGYQAFEGHDVMPGNTTAAWYWIDPLVSAQDAATVTGLSVTPSTTSIDVAETDTLSASATLDIGGPLNVTSTATWSSNATGVATVSSIGVVTGVSEGSATITATYGGFSDTCAATVTEPVVASGPVLRGTATTSSPASSGMNTVARPTGLTATDHVVVICTCDDDASNFFVTDFTAAGYWHHNTGTGHVSLGVYVGTGFSGAGVFEVYPVNGSVWVSMICAAYSDCDGFTVGTPVHSGAGSSTAPAVASAVVAELLLIAAGNISSVSSTSPSSTSMGTVAGNGRLDLRTRGTQTAGSGSTVDITWTATRSTSAVQIVALGEA